VVNKPKKPNKINSNTINSVLVDNKSSPKPKQQIDKEYYQKIKQKRKPNKKKDTYKRKIWKGSNYPNTTKPPISKSY
jgi:hypothetical protein